MPLDAHIVAVAARTPVGLTAEGSASAIRAGISRVGEHPFMIDGGGEPLQCGCDSVLEPEMLVQQRLVALASSTFSEIVAKLTATDQRMANVPLLLALPETRPGFGADDAAKVIGEMQAMAAPQGVAVTGDKSMVGHAGALRALELAVQTLMDGKRDLCIIGGVDSYFDADTLDWLDAERRLLRAEIRGGFSPGEGASMIAVATNHARVALGLPSLARVRSVACSVERRSPTSVEGLLGEALTDALSGAGAALRTPGELVADVYCDLNGERERTDDFGFALLRTNSLFRDGTDYRISTTYCGDVGAASAVLNSALAVRAWQRGYAHGPLSLVWGASWSGLRGATLFECGTA
jgi:3-oxoacyl-[acyl-carrier-protein] synthase-1